MGVSSKAILPNHTAVLVPSVQTAVQYLKRFDFKISDEEEWDGEGTKEVYVELGRANSLLLMEPIKPGAYQRALEKRGPGFHHFAVDVLKLEAFLESIATSAWRLHPVSVKTIKETRTAWLSCPGFPGLIEVQEREKLNSETPFIDQIFLKMDPVHNKLLEPIGLSSVVVPKDMNGLSLGGQFIELTKLWQSI